MTHKFEVPLDFLLKDDISLTFSISGQGYLSQITMIPLRGGRGCICHLFRAPCWQPLVLQVRALRHNRYDSKPLLRLVKDMML